MKNVNYVNDFGTVAHITRLILEKEVKIGSFYSNNNEGSGVFMARMELPKAVNCSSTHVVDILEYRESGLKIKRRYPKFQMTKGAFKVWGEFLNTLEKEFLEYINN